MRAIIIFYLIIISASWVEAARPPELAGPRAGKWAHEAAKSIAPDSQVVWGRLDNGLRYAWRPHQGVPGRVTLQLIVLAGSLDENADELGIAHYIEHLCFGGSRHFKAEDMTALFQRLGIEYGSDVNAITTFDYTAFRLDFRENDAALLREGLRLFRDFGDGVSFEARIVEQERRVVLAELRNRNSLSGQHQQASLPVVFRGLHFPARSPGGSEALIAKFTREQILGFYRRHYRPDLMVLVGAGDFDPSAMNALARDLFSDMLRPVEPIPARELGRLDARGLRAGVFRINGVNSASTEAAVVLPGAIRADSREVHVERQQRQFVMDLFGERLKKDVEGFGGEAGYDELLGYGVANASVGVPAGAWKQGVLALDRMVRLTLERGLDREDVETFRRRQLKTVGHQFDQLPTLDPGALCEALTESVTAHTVFVGFAQKAVWQREWLERFTAADAQKIFRGMWLPDTMAFHVAGGIDFELTGDKILQEVQKARRTGVGHVMPRAHQNTPFKLPLFSTPTEVAERRELPSLGAALLRLGNNVRLNFVSSRQEPGLIRAVVRVGSGLLEMPGNKPALKEFGLNTLLASGAVHYRPEVMSALIEERLLEFNVDITDRDAFSFRGLMAVEQLEVFLGLVADILHAPQFNSYVHQDQRNQAAMGRAASNSGLADGLRGLTDHLFKGDARFTWGSPLDYISMSVVDVRRWMEPSLSRGYVEVTLVGDLPEETAVPTVLKTLGALKPRAEKKTLAVPSKPVRITAPSGFTRIEFVGEQNVGLVVGTWPITEELHVRDQAALEVLAKILEIRVRAELREKLGLAYSPSAEFKPFDGFANFALLRAQVDCAPIDTSRVAPLVTAIGAEVAAQGVGEGEFMGARGILRSQLKQTFRENSFLVSILMRAQERPGETRELVELHDGLISQVTRAEVNQWAAKVLVPNNCRAAAVVPKAFLGLFEAGK